MNNAFKIFDLLINICFYLQRVSIIQINCEITANMLKDLLLFLVSVFSRAVGKMQSIKFMSHLFFLWDFMKIFPHAFKIKLGFSL